MPSEHTKIVSFSAVKVKKGNDTMAKAKKLPSGNWRVQACQTINGVTLRKSFTASDRRSAELEAAKWLSGAETEQIEKITLEKAFESYIAAKKNVLSPSTVRGYDTIQRNAFKDIMPLYVEKLSLNLLQRSVNTYSINRSAKSVRNAVGLLTAVLGMFRPEMNIKLTTPQKEKKEIYIPDDNDIKKLLNSVKGKKIEIPILLAAFGPMRRGEICALQSDDIDGNIVHVNKSMVKASNGEWIVKAPKTFSSYRTIEYPDFVIEKIKDIKGHIVEITPNTITSLFSKELKECSLPHFRFHDLRHYAVSTLHAINVPDKYIMARGGWATNYTMNNVYNHTLKSAEDKTNQKIIEHFSTVID